MRFEPDAKSSELTGSIATHNNATDSRPRRRPTVVPGGDALASDELRVALGLRQPVAKVVPSLAFAEVAATDWQGIGADSGSGDVRRQRAHGRS
jgi:hypothetical protein